MQVLYIEINTRIKSNIFCCTMKVFLCCSKERNQENAGNIIGTKLVLLLKHLFVQPHGRIKNNQTLQVPANVSDR